jgi:hypothetical protein
VAIFLKVVSGIYFILIWLVAVVALMTPLEGLSVWHKPIIVIIAATLTLPAAALYAFGTVVGDTRRIRNHLAAIRRYYEPGHHV